MVVALERAIWPQCCTPTGMMKPGISNRESAEQEARERHQFPPIDTDPPPPQDAAGLAGEEPAREDDTLAARQTSRKAGSRSSARKAARARTLDEPAPASRKVDGAFGREPEGPSPRDTHGTIGHRR
jgi:hypothetical protein